MTLSTGLHRTAIGLAADLAQWPASPNAVVFWNGVYAAMLGAVGIRLGLEMRGCFIAAFALVAAAGSYSVAGSVGVEQMPGKDALLATMAASTATLLGHLGLSAAIAFYARHVYLDAQGAFPPRRRPAPQARQSASDGEGDRGTDRATQAAAAPGRGGRTDLDAPPDPVAETAPPRRADCSEP